MISQIEKKIVVTRILPPAAQRILESRAKELNCSLWQWKGPGAIPRDVLLEKILCVDGVLVVMSEKVDETFLSACGSQCKVISTMTVGYDHIDVVACRQRNILVGYTPDVLTDATADVGILLILMVMRKAGEAFLRARQKGCWKTWEPYDSTCGNQLGSKTVLGVIGLGRIGKAMVKRLYSFGVRTVLYHGRSTLTEFEWMADCPHLSVQKSRDLHILLRQSDLVVVACTLSQETKGLLNESALDCMKEDAFLINISRGSIIDTDALVKVLKEGKLAGVGLDVTDPEPLPPNHELFSFNKVVILPHIGSATKETREAMGLLSLNNLFQGVLGECYGNENTAFIPH